MEGKGAVSGRVVTLTEEKRDEFGWRLGVCGRKIGKGNIDQGTWDHFYHLPNCRHYKYMVLNTDLGEGYFCSEKEAQEAGFRLAPDCLR